MNLSKSGIFELASNFFPVLRDLKLINTGLETLDKLNQIKSLASLNLSRNQIRIQNGMEWKARTIAFGEIPFKKHTATMEELLNCFKSHSVLTQSTKKPNASTEKLIGFGKSQLAMQRLTS